MRRKRRRWRKRRGEGTGRDEEEGGQLPLQFGFPSTAKGHLSTNSYTLFKSMH